MRVGHDEYALRLFATTKAEAMLYQLSAHAAALVLRVNPDMVDLTDMAVDLDRGSACEPALDLGRVNIMLTNEIGSDLQLRAPGFYPLIGVSPRSLGTDGDGGQFVRLGLQRFADEDCD